MMVATYFPNYYLGVHAFPIPYSSSPDFLIFSILSIYVSSWRYICCSHFKIDIDFVNLDFFLFVLRPSCIMGKVRKFEKRKTWQSSSSVFTKDCKCSFQSVFSEISGVSFIRLHKVTPKDYNKNSLKWLIRNGYLSEHNKCFCNAPWNMPKINYMKVVEQWM